MVGNGRIIGAERIGFYSKNVYLNSRFRLTAVLNELIVYLDRRFKKLSGEVIDCRVPLPNIQPSWNC